MSSQPTEGITLRCDRRQEDVTRRDCALCWLRCEGNPEMMRLVVTQVRRPAPLAVRPVMEAVPLLLGWDDCLARHLNPDTLTGASAEKPKRDTGEATLTLVRS